MIRVSSATFLETLVARKVRMSAWVSCAYFPKIVKSHLTTSERFRTTHLLRRCDPARSNGPNRFIRNYDSLPLVVVIDQFSDGSQLSSNDFSRLVRLSLLEVFPDAEDDLEGGLVQRGVGLFESKRLVAIFENKGNGTNLGSDEFIRLVEDSSSFRVTQNDPRKSEILQLSEAASVARISLRLGN